MREKQWKPLVYVCSPFSGDKQANTEKARRFCRFVVDNGAIPIAPHLLLPQFMSEETERDEAMFMNMVFLGKCEQVWVFGNEITSGMVAEIEKAMVMRKTIRYFTEKGEEFKWS